MPAIQYWITGPAVGAGIVFLGGFASLAYNWYSAAATEETAALDKAAAQDAQLKARRAAYLQRLTNEYVASHDGITPAMMAGNELPPKDWLDQRLKELGQDWQVQ